jgi:hypothetical protein
MRIFGTEYAVIHPVLQDWARELAALPGIGSNWKTVWASFLQGPGKEQGAVADGGLFMLYSAYSVSVRAAMNTGNYPPEEMMLMVGGRKKFPAENSIWFLLETAGHWSEAAGDIINALGAELTFLNYFLGNYDAPAVIEQAGVLLAILVHQKHKWPAYFEWMPMQNRLENVREAFLLGGPDLEITHMRGKNEELAPGILQVYTELGKFMYQFDFFLRLRDYAATLEKSGGRLDGSAKRIRDQLLAI